MNPGNDSAPQIPPRQPLRSSLTSESDKSSIGKLQVSFGNYQRVGSRWSSGILLEGLNVGAEALRPGKSV